MKINHNSQILNITQKPQLYENDEGGFNLVEVKEIIFRQIYLIAGITTAVASLALLKALIRPPMYVGNFEILAESVTIQTSFTASGARSQQTQESEVAADLNETQLKELTSPKMILPIVDQLKERYPDINYNSIISSLQLETNQQQNILVATYQNSDQNQVQDVLEALTTTYLNYSLERRQAGVNRGMEFLDQQIPKAQADVNALNQQLQFLRDKYNFIDPQIQANQLSGQLQNLANKKLDIKSQLNETQIRAGDLSAELSRQQSTTSAPAIEFGTSRYEQLHSDLRAIEVEIAQKSAIFSDSSVEMQTLREQRDRLEALLAQEGKTVQKNASDKINILTESDRIIGQEISNIQQEMKQWTAIARNYEEIAQELEIAKERLRSLLLEKEALSIDIAQKEAPWRILTPVGEPTTDSASLFNDVVLGATFGLLLGMGVAFALDKYQNILYTSAQIQEITHLPILGIIPFDPSHKQLSLPDKTSSLAKSPQTQEEDFESLLEEQGLQLYDKYLLSSNLLSPSAEAFRFFGANLNLFDANNPIRSLMITSAISGEGKSTVAINIAKTAAALGRRVLVVDTDMRSAHDLSAPQAPTHRGLSNLLLNKNLNFDEVIQQSPLEDNLFIMSSGNYSSIIDDPSRLLASPKMWNLMEELKAHFDLIIYDSSPMIKFADVSLLAPKTDGVVLVTGLGKLQTIKFKEALDKLSLSNTPVLGILINKVTAK
ncbi:polysaccharide biosynthesis tyrosine autokinase [Pleurocapsales cyanobacterium LEGE 06147]|nr:polysaccharide biosynthesis tyrosine autokinase [Pleurocapsales cyanobacterium LEGE 06147]